MLEIFRRDLNWSQQDLAYRLRVSQRTISNLERDIFDISKPIFEQILCLLVPEIISADGYRFMIEEIGMPISDIAVELGVLKRTVSRWLDIWWNNEPTSMNFRKLVALYFKAQGYRKVPHAF